MNKDTDLTYEVQKFKEWIEEDNPHTNWIGWEYEYPHWIEMYRVVDTFIELNSFNFLSKLDRENLIYLIARDNGCRHLISQLKKYPSLFQYLLPFVVKSNEVDARWQFTEILGIQIIPFNEAESYLLQLVVDTDEYVSRKALHSLGKIGSKHTESLCKKAWETNHEYQRIMVLWTLFEMDSKQLNKYLSLAMKDERKNIVINAKEIYGKCGQYY